MWQNNSVSERNKGSGFKIKLSLIDRTFILVNFDNLSTLLFYLNLKIAIVIL